MGRRIIRQSQILGFNRNPVIWSFDFPEESYPCLPDRLDEYNYRVELGKHWCKNNLLAIVGCARDIEEQIYRTIHTWEIIGELFQDYRIMIYESDSVDNTKSILKEWEFNNPKVRIVSENLALKRKIDLSEQRFEIMAAVRNKYHAYTCEHFSQFEYICVADADLRGPTSINGILNSFGYCGYWDVISANGLDSDAQYYYDMAVLYEKNFEPESLMVEQKPGATYANIKRGYTRPKYTKGTPLIHVASAFGGMAFYRNEVFKQSAYSAELCDHASFHKILWEKGYDQIFINPSMILIR